MISANGKQAIYEMSENGQKTKDIIKMLCVEAEGKVLLKFLNQ